MKRLVKAFAVLFGLLLTAALIIPLFFEDEIGKSAIAYSKNLLRTDLSVEGTSLSLIRDFPYVSVSLTDIKLEGFQKGRLLNAKRVSGRMTYYDLFFGEGIQINTITVEDAEIFVYRGADKKGNWEVLKPQETSSSSSFTIDLSRILLENVQIIYEDVSTDTKANFQVADGELTGAFGSEAYTLNGKLAGRSEFLNLGTLRYISDMALAVDLELKIDPQNSVYEFGPSTITLDGMPVDVAGSIGFVKGSTAYNLDLSTEKGQLGALLRALPEDWITPSIRQLDTRGAFHLDGSVKGFYDALKSPAINFEGRLLDGSLSLPALKKKASNVTFSLLYSNGKGRSMADSKLELTGINAQLDGQPLNGSFTWSNFNDPLYDIDVTGTLPLSWLDELWEGGSFDGELGIRNLQIKGRQRHLVDGKHAKNITTSGELVANNASVTYGGEHFDIDAEGINLSGADLIIDGASIEGLNNRLALELALEGFVPFLFGDAPQILMFRGEVATKELDLEKWVGIFSQESSTSSKDDEGPLADEPIAAGFAARLKLKADKLHYNDVRGSRFSGTCTLDNSLLKLHSEGYAMEGHWEVDGEMKLRTKISLSAKLACSEVNITELFEDTENLGQEVIEAKHLDGQMTTRAFVEASWDEKGNLDMNALHVWANVGLTDGGLRDFEMLQALSKFVDSDELRNIRFTDVENWIEVEKSTVYLPAMFIQSTATNFTVAGQHSFEHKIDYAIRVNGMQVIMNKLFGKRPGIEFLPDRRDGIVKTGFKIEGELEGDNYDVQMDGKDVRRQFRHSQVRKDAIRTKLAALFGQERLIDDYDAEGVRIPGRPQRGSRPVADRVERESRDYSSSTMTASTPTTSYSAAAPNRAVEVDTDTYIEGWDDEETVPAEEDNATSPRPALSGSGSRPKPTSEPSSRPMTKPANTSKKPEKGKLLDGLFQPTTPAQNVPVVNDGEFLEGFDLPSKPD